MTISSRLPSLGAEVKYECATLLGNALWGLGIAYTAGCRDRTRLAMAVAISSLAWGLRDIPARFVLRSQLSTRTKLIVTEILEIMSRAVEVIAFRHFNVIGRMGTLALGAWHGLFTVGGVICMRSSGDEAGIKIDMRLHWPSITDAIFEGFSRAAELQG